MGRATVSFAGQPEEARRSIGSRSSARRSSSPAWPCAGSMDPEEVSMSRARLLLAALVCAMLSVVAPAHAIDFRMDEAFGEPPEIRGTDQFRVWLTKDNVWHVAVSSGEA